MSLITEPGVFQVPIEAYHSDPISGGSLSSGGIRKLIPPSCPAVFDYWRKHREPPKRVWDLGHAAHYKVLGDGPEIVVVDADSYRSKVAQQQRDDAYARGAVPILPKESDQVDEMAAQILKNETAAALLAPGSGTAEQAMFWQDEQTGVWCRALVDWLRHPDGKRRLILVDYKTADSAHPEAFARSAARIGYQVQAAHYTAGARALGLDDDPAFVFVVQEKKPPYLVTCVELDAYSLDIGIVQREKAIRTYIDCSEKNTWPGYAEGIIPVSLPAWAGTEPIEETA